jgi:uncharacterized protein YaiE (UPF0345 family)
VAQQTLYNGVRYSFTDLSIEGETTQLYGSIPFNFPKGVIQALNFSWQSDSAEVQGNQIAPVGMTNGYGTASGSIEILVSEADDWIKTITSNGFYPAANVFFNLRITSSVNGTDVRMDSLRSCRLKGGSSNNQKGSDALTSPFDLRIGLIYKNGILMYGDPSA